MFVFLFEQFGKNGVGIKVVDNHDVLGDAAGGDGEFSCLITVDLTGEFDGFHVDPMGSDRQLIVGHHDGFNGVVGEGRGRGDIGALWRLPLILADDGERAQW